MADDFDLVKISELPAATSPGEYDVLAGVQSGDTKQFSFSVLLAWMQQAITASAIGAVPITRKVNGKALSTDITLTAADLGAYALPSGGIPKTDLAQGVQDSLDNADSAYQMPSGGIPSSDMASAVQTSLGKADTAYQKPSSGIPASDLASGVIPSVPSISTSTPNMDGIGAAGSTGDVSDAGHVHPSDTTKANTNTLAKVLHDPAGENVAVGEYAIYNGQLYTANTAITSSMAASTFASYLTAVSGGGLNALGVRAYTSQTFNSTYVDTSNPDEMIHVAKGGGMAYITGTLIIKQTVPQGGNLGANFPLPVERNAFILIVGNISKQTSMIRVINQSPYSRQLATTTAINIANDTAWRVSGFYLTSD